MTIIAAGDQPTVALHWTLPAAKIALCALPNSSVGCSACRRSRADGYRSKTGAFRTVKFLRCRCCCSSRPMASGIIRRQEDACGPSVLTWCRNRSCNRRRQRRRPYRLWRHANSNPDSRDPNPTAPFCGHTQWDRGRTDCEKVIAASPARLNDARQIEPLSVMTAVGRIVSYTRTGAQRRFRPFARLRPIGSNRPEAEVFSTTAMRQFRTRVTFADSCDWRRGTH